MTIAVKGGRSREECRAVAYAIGQSPLVKTAFFASDPNLGRILAAIGYAGIADLVITSYSIHYTKLYELRVFSRDGHLIEEIGQRRRILASYNFV